ncbi:MAG: hypothetical protein J0I66_11155, partial [Microbacterium sp.]|nr:hypothetical protein [Microbacterium sp.]
MSEPTTETAADVAARVFETQRLSESTPEAVRAAVDAVGVVFKDDDAKARAAARIAEGFPAGLSVDAARRLVAYSLGDPAFREYLKPEPTALDRATARLQSQRQAAAPPP